MGIGWQTPEARLWRNKEKHVIRRKAHGGWTQGPARENREAQEKKETSRQSSQEQIARAGFG
jgi:hypothetical protein